MAHRPEDPLLSFDRDHLWHPYTSMTRPLQVYPVTEAQGVRIKLRDGRELIDGMSSWWSAIHGYNVPQLNAAARAQIDRMSHVMFGGLTHEPAVELGALLHEITPDAIDKIFFCDSGSVSVEVAMKMAIQYWHAAGKPEKTRFLTIRSGYHGDTFHAMAVTDPVNGMHTLFKGVLPEYFFADQPRCRYGTAWNERDLHSFKHLIGRHAGCLAAVILEPIVQGAGGMYFYAPEYLAAVRRLCDERDVLLVHDEIATGFGRTGRMFACEHAEVTPDIMCVGKALTGGYMTLAAAMTTDHVAAVISSGEAGVFMHGPTFMANPLACSIAAASIRLLKESPWQERIAHIEHTMKERLAVCRDYGQVSDVRVLGGIGVIELTRPVNMGLVQQRFVDRGVWIRPFGRLVYIMPPYVIGDQDLDALLTAMAEVVKSEDILA